VIVVPVGGGRLRLVTQPDHASLAADVLGLWRADGLPEHPRRSVLLAATRAHDNGWQEADAAPRLDAAGRPADFRRFPDEERREIWRRGVERLAASAPYVGALLAEHALAIHRDRAGEPEWAEFAAALGGRRAELARAAGVTAAELAADYRFLYLADVVSLVLCGTWDAFAACGVRGRLRGPALEVDPFPLAGATGFRVPCRHVPDRPYSGEADLAAELGPARWEELAVRLVPPGEP
jgi:hypothetical protein